MLRGTVKWFNNTKGYGFIEYGDLEDIFVHYSAIRKDGYKTLKEGNIVDIAAEMKILNKAGSWYSYQEERIGQGRENAKEYLATHPEVAQEIEEKIRAAADTLDDLNVGIMEETETETE